jgi:dolichyl-phosphate-mannose-protein mannosyltransferase
MHKHAVNARALRWISMQQVAAFCGLLAVIIILQIFDGAFHSELGGHPDEPPHYVTGLLVRDYIAAGLPGSPLAYAQDYYDHYPKVALGNWPPGFYLLQAAWTLAFSPQRTAVMLLMAALTAMLGTVLFAALRSLFNAPLAAAGALFLVTLPLVQWLSARVMPDTTLALLSLVAIIFFGRFLDSERGGDALLFGLFSAAAVLTKGTGLALALVPPVALLLTGKWHLLKRPSLWGAALIVAILAGPWTWMFREVTRASWAADSLDVQFLRWAIPFYAGEWAAAIGLAFVPLACLGVWATLGTTARRHAAHGIWPASAALIVGLLLLLVVTPAGTEARYLMPIIPPTILFCAAGVWALSDLTADWSRYVRIAAAALFIGLAAWSTAGATVKNETGYEAVVKAVLERGDAAKARLLIVSDAVGEGQFIAEMAMREHRPGHTIRRASKVLSSSSWTGRNYRLLVRNPDHFLSLLASENIDLLVVDQTVPRPLPHDRIVLEALRTHADRFSLLARFSAARDSKTYPDGISLYAIIR